MALSEVQRRSVQLESLYYLGNTLTSLMESEGLLENICYVTSQAVKARCGHIVLVDQQFHEYLSHSGYGLTEAVAKALATDKQGPARLAIDDGQPLLINDAADARLGKTLKSAGIGSVISVPLRALGRTMGALTVAEPAGASTFSEDDLYLLGTVANLTALVLERTHFYGDMIADPATGAYNHAYFSSITNRLVEEARRYAAPISVIMVDVADMKGINDKYGFAAGDRILREISVRLQGIVRSADVVGRYGGDEFGLVLPKTDAKGAAILADRVRHEISTIALNGGESLISAEVHVGVATLGDTLKGSEDLLKAAHAAAKADKKTSKK
ncbi:MAG: sensor domain-containing diguanylate cyclase [Chloroflexota bacterium]